MSDNYQCRKSSRALSYLGNQTLLHDCYFEDSAAEFMDTFYEYKKDHQENLSSPVPADLAYSELFGEPPTQSDTGLQQSPYSRSQDPAQQSFEWKIQGEKIDPNILSNTKPSTLQISKPGPNANLQNTHKYRDSYTQQSSIQPSFTSPPATQTPSSTAYLFPPVSISSSSRINEVSKTKPWTAAETQTLKRLHSLGRSWEEIARAMPGRSESGCRQRFERVREKHRAPVGDLKNVTEAGKYNIGEENEGWGRGGDEIIDNERDDYSGMEKGLRGEIWTAEEDGLLGDIVARGGSFGEAAEMLQRSLGACRKRYYEYLGPWRSRRPTSH